MNKIVTENAQPGAPATEWDVIGLDDGSIEGFATEMSVNLGETVHFKINTVATAYHLDIYRMGYYGGKGARKVVTVQPFVNLPQFQPAGLSDPTTGLLDCGNWGVSASWTIPADATSGIYFAKLVREDGNTGASHLFFIVRDDHSHADLLFQTSDTTWQAYNAYGGNSLYAGLPVGRAYKVSYNRPFITRSNEQGANYLFNAEYPMVRWLEANGYDVSYCAGMDTDRFGDHLLHHKVFLSVGHDEYWSAQQRANVEAARDAGVHLAFLSGNAVYWKVRWESSVDGSQTPYRTLVCYKETHDNRKSDPTPAWTGTWRDPRFSPPSDGGHPENALTGTLSKKVAGFSASSILVPAEHSTHRFWRHTDIGNHHPPELTAGTLGYEWDEDLDNGVRPPGLMHVSATTEDGVSCLQDYGSTYRAGTATHHLTLYRHRSGALVFSAGTVQWAWGLDEDHDTQGRPTGPSDAHMRQAMVNLFADMGVEPASLQPDLVPATASTDTHPPTSTITAPADGATLQPGQPVTILGTASDAEGIVGAVEVSVNDGVTWHPAVGREQWSYAWTPSGNGKMTILSRAVDDSGNLETPSAGISVVVGQASGAPMLVLVNSAYPVNPFGDYLTEILRGEGLVAFQKRELASLDREADPLSYLNTFKIVLLAETKLRPDQQQLMRSYVAGGGTLIAMRPDPALADLFGLSFAGERAEQPTQPLQFFAFDTAGGPGAGVTAPLQYHGRADKYTITGASVLAYLCDDIYAPSANPAITIHAFGNGKAVAFAFDLAKTIVLMRQGNPEWKNSEGDGAMFTPAEIANPSTVERTDELRTMDLFVRLDGRMWFAPECLWVPQADEAQRFLAALIVELMNQPVPRLWYLPGTHKALLINNGDGCSANLAHKVETLNDAAEHGGSFSVYLVREQIGTELDQDTERSWRNAGYEVGVHMYGNGRQTYAALRQAYGAITQALQDNYGHVSRSARNHTIDWVGWVDMAKIEAELGTRLDLNYYHYYRFESLCAVHPDPKPYENCYPLSLPTKRRLCNGYFTGSGLPQRFCDETGALLPIYQLLTEWPDEWFADNGFTPDEVFAIAKGMIEAAQHGYYSAFVPNIHPVRYQGAESVTPLWVPRLWDYAQDHGVPMWSAEKLLDFVEARNAARFDNLGWTGRSLTFDFRTPTGGQQLTLMLPADNLFSLEVDGVAVEFTKDTLAGRTYTLFTTTAASAHVVARYGQGWVESTATDFNRGTLESTQVVGLGEGAVSIAGTVVVPDVGQSDGAHWESWPASGDLTRAATWRVLNHCFVHDFNEDVPTYHPAVFSPDLVPAGDLSLMARQRITQVTNRPGSIGVLGFIVGGQDPQNYHIIQYAQDGLGLRIYRRNPGMANFTLVGQTDLPDLIVGRWYDMRIDVVGTTFTVYVDGLLRLTASDAAYLPGRIGLLGYEGSRNEYDDVVMTTGPFASAGIYTSRVFDAGASVTWGPISWESHTHPGTSLAFSIRTGDTPLPDNTWTAFNPIPLSGSTIGSSSRYLQYRVILATTNTLITPVLKEVRVIYH